MKNIKLLHALIAACLPAFACAQTEEKSLPPEYFSVTHPAMQAWEDYFQEKYFSKGYSPDALGEGTGYLPYLREKRMYEMRKDFLGDAGGTKRWDVFRHIRSKSLDRDGPTPAADWKSLGPNKMEGQGGRMISHAFDPENAQVIWAGSASGGLWLSENGGDSWQPMTDQIPSVGIGAIAVNPLNPNVLIIGTGEGYGINSFFTRPGLGVFKSTDRGMSWQPTDFAYHQTEGVSAFKLAWSYVDTNIVWLAATNGIWKSTDSGVSWERKLGDGSNQTNFICTDIVQHSFNPDTLFAAITWDGIWRSTDGGEHWTKLDGGLPTNDLHFINLDLCRSQPNVLYASIAGAQASNFGLKGLYRSENGGDSWQKIEGAPNAFCIPWASTNCQGWYNNVVAVSPNDPELVWLGGTTLRRSINGGQNWTEHDRYKLPNSTEPPPCLTYVDQHDFAFDPQNPQTVYAFNDGGVAKSTDGGTCFEFKNEGLQTAQFYSIASGPKDPGTVIASTQDHALQGIKLSENTHLAWDRWGFSEGGDVEVHNTNSNILYGTGFEGKFWRTTGGVHSLSTEITNGINLAENGNNTWSPAVRKHPTQHLCLLGSTRQKLYKTTNGGFLWTPVATMAEPRVYEFDKKDPNYAYAAAWSFNGTWSFWRSENGGDTWTQTANSPGWRVTDIKASPAQAGLVYVSRNSNLPNVAHIYKSSNFGATWTSIQGDLPDLPVNAIAVHSYAPGVLFAATDLGVFITTDDGQHWTEYNDHLPVSFALDIEFNPTDTTLCIGTYGRGAWRTKAWMPETVSTFEPIQSSRFGISLVSPNPASNQVQVSYFLEKTAEIRVEVLNGLGQKVAAVFSGKQTPGEYSCVWNGLMHNGLSAKTGLYFVQMKMGDRSVTKQLFWQ